MEKFFIKDSFMLRNYSLSQLPVINKMNEKISQLINPPSLNKRNVGSKWKILKKYNNEIYFHSSSLDLIAKISITKKSDVNYYALYLERPWEIDYNSKTKKEEKKLLDLSTANLKDFFRNKEEQSAIPVELLSPDNTSPKTKEQLLTILSKSDYSRESIGRFKTFSLEMLQSFISMGDYSNHRVHKIGESQQMFSILCDLLKVEVDIKDFFKVSDNEKAYFDTGFKAKGFSAAFDYLYASLLALDATSENKAVVYNDMSSRAYLIDVAGQKVICTTDQTASWLSVKGNSPGTWTSYAFTSPFSTPEEYMALGPNIIKPSLEIEDYNIKSFDMWLTYCQYSLFNSIYDVQEKLEAARLSPAITDSFETIIEKIIEKNDITLEKSNIEKSLQLYKINNLKALKI